MRISLAFTAGAKANQRASMKLTLNPLAEPCLICGEWIADAKAAHYVEVDTSARAIVGEERAPDSQGAFPVGADCWRRLPAEVKDGTPGTEEVVPAGARRARKF